MATFLTQPTPDQAELKAITIRIPADIAARLNQLSATYSKPVAVLCRDAVIAYASRRTDVSVDRVAHQTLQELLAFRDAVAQILPGLFSGDEAAGTIADVFHDANANKQQKATEALQGKR